MQIDKTQNALIWIINILNSHKIDHQITGGFAGKIFGSERKLNDIDIDISEKHFHAILPEIKEYVTYGPAHYKDAKWDLELITLNYKGQEIDLCGIDNPQKISNKERTKWINYPGFLSEALSVNFNGLNIKVIHPKYFLQYKKELDGEHQLEDIEAVEEYLSKNK